jgi:ferric-dicitrate binding protein FerR (iron transport regulator)
MTVTDAMSSFLGQDVFCRLGWDQLTPCQRDAILSVFRSGLNAGAASGAVLTIEEVLADGRVVLCDDGSQWETEGEDADTVEDWGEGALVAVHRGMLYRLDAWQAVEVEPLRL